MEERRKKSFENWVDDVLSSFLLLIVFSLFCIVVFALYGVAIKPAVKCFELCDGGAHVVECRFYDGNNSETPSFLE